nr:DNA methyltransferase [Mycoplasmopsis bovis]
MDLSTSESDIVLDFFLGSGTTVLLLLTKWIEGILELSRWTISKISLLKD